MRLIDLQPRWVAEYGAPEGTKQGVSFRCPHCQSESTRLAVFFDVPICGAPAVDIKAVHRSQADESQHLHDHHVGSVLWHREGDSFETLTLTPSVDASHFGHWHGFVTGGEIR